VDEMSTQLSAHTQKIRDPLPALLQEYGVKLQHGSRQENISRLFRIYKAIRYKLQQTKRNVCRFVYK
jgi:hypothetical protein